MNASEADYIKDTLKRMEEDMGRYREHLAQLEPPTTCLLYLGGTYFRAEGPWQNGWQNGRQPRRFSVDWMGPYIPGGLAGAHVNFEPDGRHPKTGELCYRISSIWEDRRVEAEQKAAAAERIIAKLIEHGKRCAPIRRALKRLEVWNAKG